MTRSAKGTRGSRWTRKELLAVLYFYVKRKEELATPQSRPSTRTLARAIGRTNASISMRIANYRSEDPACPGHGLEGDGPSIEIWREYESAPDRLLAEARRAYQELIPGDARGTRPTGRTSPCERGTTWKTCVALL